jgi:pseudaminic acid biosynthesis-associated methylase
MDQVRIWQGDFGKAYTDRNPVDWRVRAPAFRTMVGGLVIASALEVGCNRGHNLGALRHVLGPAADLAGIEPNAYARQLGREAEPSSRIVDGTAARLPFPDDAFDLVFTAGVLIHIPLPDLQDVLRGIHRVSRKYVLAIEYFSEEDTVIPYRGHDNLLWKHNFPQYYLRAFPDLSLLRQGHWTAEDGFDRCDWWKPHAEHP